LQTRAQRDADEETERQPEQHRRVAEGEDHVSGCPSVID
jgi:hypothetical protein